MNNANVASTGCYPELRPACGHRLRSAEVTEFIESGQPEVGDHLDESAVVPSSKAHTPPLQDADEVRFGLTVGQDGLSLHGKAKVRGWLEVPVTFACLAAIGLGVAWGVA